MATGPDPSKTQDFPPDLPILSDDQLDTVRKPNDKDIASLISKISQVIVKDLEKTQNIRERERKDNITIDSVGEIINRIGVMPRKRVEELRKNKNKYFEGNDELATQEYLNTIQLRKNLNINYSRFYHSFFSNLDDAEELESHPVIKNIFFPNLPESGIQERLANWKQILNKFKPEIPNKMVERVYVYQNKRYGDRNLLVASNIEDQSDEWVPRVKQPSSNNEAIITNKLRTFLLKNRDDSEKCYPSMKDDEQIAPKDANEFLMYILLKDIYNVYSYMTQNKVNTKMYSVFVYGLLQLMLGATETYFLPEDKNEHFTNLRIQKRPQKKVEKNAFSQEMARIGRFKELEADDDGSVNDTSAGAIDAPVVEGTGTGANAHEYSGDNGENDADPNQSFSAFLDLDQDRDFDGEDGFGMDDDNAFTDAANNIDD
jgi:hypothetical protein